MMARSCKMKKLKFLSSKNYVLLTGNETSVLSDAMTGDWNGKYIQVKLQLTTPRVGISDEIRKRFGDRGGDVLSVELELPETEQGPTIPVEDMKRPEEIFAQFHRSNYDGNPPDETLTQTFSELVQLVEESE